MSGRAKGSHRVVRWLWTAESPMARVARAGLLPLAGLFRAAVAVRTSAYERGFLPTRDLGLPTVAIGNLTVGGSGKTPLAAWVAQQYGLLGWRPGILLRGHGADERYVHERLVPEAVVVANPDRVAGARQAAASGADVLVLDDAFQRLDVRRDLNIAVVAAEVSRAVPWLLPAGPWREGWDALDRADLVIVSRKRASTAVAQEFAERIEERIAGRTVARCLLGIVRLDGMISGARHEPDVVRGRRVLASAGVADPDAFAAQVRAAGGRVRLVAWNDHHAYDREDAEWLASQAARADVLVVTEKDAVKLRHRWPPDAAEPLVAVLDVTWEEGEAAVRDALAAVVEP